MLTLADDFYGDHSGFICHNKAYGLHRDHTLAWDLKKLKKFHFNQVSVTGYSFFMFVMYLLNKFNYSIKEIPINFHERTHGKSKIPKIETFRTLLTLLLIKIGYFK